MAFDGRTGSVVWSANVGTYDQLARLMTDGRVLLVGLTPEEGAAAGSLVAFSLADGQRLWHAPLPDGLDAAWTQGHVLVAGDGARSHGVGRAGQPVSLTRSARAAEPPRG